MALRRGSKQLRYNERFKRQERLKDFVKADGPGFGWLPTQSRLFRIDASLRWHCWGHRFLSRSLPGVLCKQTQEFVRNDIKDWLKFMRWDVGFDGWRFDFVRGYPGRYAGEYVEVRTPVCTERWRGAW